MNGTIVQTATAILPTIPFLHASIAMNITVQIWMISIRAKLIMNMPALPAWIATQPGVTNRPVR